MTGDTTTCGWEPERDALRPRSGHLVLCVLACVAQPERVGEVAFLHDFDHAVVGRSGDLVWVRDRPGRTVETGPFDDPMLSRTQLELTRRGSGIEVRNTGRVPMRLNGYPAQSCPLKEGDLVELGDRVMLRVSRRGGLPEVDSAFSFGRADPNGWVGESWASWTLRARVAFVAQRRAHVLVTGPSGSGKELVARALHALSPRSRHAMVSRNAATIPDSIADAELFGHAAGYPNPGMPARPGLIGEADRSTLFLDELAELPIEQQARLLRVLDGGEYTRLGEARPRRADLRLVAATNRDPEALKHDLRARLKIQIEVPSLVDRVDDIPLVAVHLLRRIAEDDPELAATFFPGRGDLREPPQTTFRWVRQIVTHPYRTHVRELERLLWQSITEARDGILDAVAGRPSPARRREVSNLPIDPFTLDPEVVQAALDRHGGHQEPVWRELGLSSRHVLARFVKKHGLRVRRRAPARSSPSKDETP